jgi:hypothetical protein
MRVRHGPVEGATAVVSILDLGEPVSFFTGTTSWNLLDASVQKSIFFTL